MSDVKIYVHGTKNCFTQEGKLKQSVELGNMTISLKKLLHNHLLKLLKLKREQTSHRDCTDTALLVSQQRYEGLFLIICHLSRRCRLPLLQRGRDQKIVRANGARE